MCIRRHKDMTCDQFQDYWSNKHGPFFMKNTGDYESQNILRRRGDPALKVLTN